MSYNLPPFEFGRRLLLDPQTFCEATAGLEADTILRIGYLIYLFVELGLPMPLINGRKCFWWPLDDVPDAH